MISHFVWDGRHSNIFGINFWPGINFLNFLENFFWSFDLVKSNTKCPVNVFPVEVVKLLSWYLPFSILKFLKSITCSYKSSAIVILFLWFFLFAYYKTDFWLLLSSKSSNLNVTISFGLDAKDHIMWINNASS